MSFREGCGETPSRGCREAVLVSVVYALEAEKEDQYSKEYVGELSNFSYIYAYANSIWVVLAANLDLPATQASLKAKLMGYLQVKPPSLLSLLAIS